METAKTNQRLEEWECGMVQLEMTITIHLNDSTHLNKSVLVNRTLSFDSFDLKKVQAIPFEVAQSPVAVL